MYLPRSLYLSRARAGGVTSNFCFTLLAFVALVLSVLAFGSPPW
jgi:hypothetical protein